MGKSSVIRATAAAICAFASLAAPAYSRSSADLFRMTPADFARTVSSKDDALETQAEFDTYNGWLERPSDVFLRAYVDKTTGAVTYQLYATVSFAGDWRFYNRINYELPGGGVGEGQLSRVDSNANCGTYGCNLTEDVVFDVPEPLLRALASVYRPGGNSSWHFKLKGKYNNADYQNGIIPAEAAGLLSAVDTYRARLPKTK
jgi:hypothetical protein